MELIQSLTMLEQGIARRGDSLILMGIALAVCILGVQVVCIIALAKKLARAGREQGREDGGDNRNSYSEFGFAAIGMAAFPFSVESILTVLVGLNALAAGVFLILVIAVRSKGYDFVAQSKKIAEPVQKAEEKPVVVPEAAPYVAPAPEAAPVATPTPEPVVAAGEAVGTEAVASVNEETVAAPAAELAVAAYAGKDIVPASVNREVTTVIRGGDGQPIRIVKIEKEFTETIRETVPGAVSATGTNEQTQQLIDRISRLIEKLETNGEAKGAHLENGIFLAADQPVPADEDEEDELEETSGVDEAGDEDDVDLEAEGNDHFTGNERILGFDEETGYYIVAHYRKSFEAKLIQSRPHIKHYYSELKNALLAYNGTKSRVSWAADSFHNGRTTIAKINVKTKVLELYLALEPASLEGTVYRGQDVSHLKKYSDTPFRYKIRTPRKLKWALELIQRVSEEQGLSPIDIERVDYEDAYPFEDTDSLVSRGLIKEYIREEKPASTFELDESHVPSVADLDETVIPANANISWEFDNEVLAQKALEEEQAAAKAEAETEAPTVEEEAPVSEPAEESAAAPQTTVIRETTRTTQVRYTEQYFGASGEVTSFKEYLTEDGPVDPEFFEAELRKEAAADSDTVQAEVFYEEHPAEETYTEERVEEFADVDADYSESYGEDAYGAGDYGETSQEESNEAYAETSEETDAEDGELDWSVPAGLSVQSEDVVFEDDGVTYEDEPVYEDEQVYADSEVYEDEQIYEDSEVVYEEEAVYSGEEIAYEESDRDADEDSGEDAEQVPVEEEAPQIPKLNPDVALVDIGLLNENFQDGDVVDLELLKERGLVMSNTKILKIYKSGELSKGLTVIADHFTMDAIFAIDGAGGNIQMIRK